MILIGEKLNSSIPSALDAMYDEEQLKKLISEQAEYGADYLDVNTALLGDAERSEMLRVCKMVQSRTDCGIVLDSPNPDVILSCLDKLDGDIIINSVIPGDARYSSLIAEASRRGVGLVCLPMCAGRIPHTAAERLNAAKGMTEMLLSAGCKPENIYIDILIQSIATDATAAVTALDTVRLLSEALPGCKTICGLSNVSFGLPIRSRLNSSMLAVAMYLGLGAAILDVTSQSIRDTVFSSSALFGKDEFCIDYITHARASMK